MFEFSNDGGKICPFNKFKFSRVHVHNLNPEASLHPGANLHLYPLVSRSYANKMCPLTLNCTQILQFSVDVRCVRMMILLI